MDLLLFLEIIETEGIRFLREQKEGSFTFRVYQSRTGGAVFIDMEYEDIPPHTCCMYLEKLDLQDVAERMLPEAWATFHGE